MINNTLISFFKHFSNAASTLAKRVMVFLLAIFTTFAVVAQHTAHNTPSSGSLVTVRLTRHETSSLTISVQEGAYAIRCGKGTKPLTAASLSACGSKVHLRTSEGFCENADTIAILQRGRYNVLRIRENAYEGDFHITARDGHLVVYNIIEQERYIAAVAVCEMGKGLSLNCYHIACLCARTKLYYTMAGEKKDYDIDDARTQSYSGYCQYDNARQAASQTEGLVIKYHGKVIDALYCANSGGECAKAEDVFGAPLPYLHIGPDPASLAARSINSYCDTCVLWERHYPLRQWRNIIAQASGNASTDISQWLFFTQFQRIKYWNGVALTKIRKAANLKSSFFNVSYDAENDLVVVEGNGYGHGVGLSQQGARWLVEVANYTPEQVISYYYPGTQIEHHATEVAASTASVPHP